VHTNGVLFVLLSAGAASAQTVLSTFAGAKDKISGTPQPPGSDMLNTGDGSQFQQDRRRKR